MARRGGVFAAIVDKDAYMQPEQRAVPVKIADMTTQDADELVECPYDKVHRIRMSRFPMHIMKCRKNYAGKEMFTCPFNARHLVPAPEARHHIANCPDRALIEKDLVHGCESGINSSYCKGNTNVPNYSRDFKEPVSTENWDEELKQDMEREYWGPTGDNNGSNGYPLPRPKGRGIPRNIGTTGVGSRPQQQPEMRLPRQPAQAAAAAAAVLQQHEQRYQQEKLQMQQQQHQQHQVTHSISDTAVPKTQPPVNVAGLGRGQFKGQGQRGRVMAANLWGTQPLAPEPATATQQPRPGGLGQSGWNTVPAASTQNTSLPAPGLGLDDFPALTASKPTTYAGIGRGLGRGISKYPAGGNPPAVGQLHNGTN